MQKLCLSLSEAQAAPGAGSGAVAAPPSSLPRLSQSACDDPHSPATPLPPVPVLPSELWGSRPQSALRRPSVPRVPGEPLRLPAACGRPNPPRWAREGGGGAAGAVPAPATRCRPRAGPCVPGNVPQGPGFTKTRLSGRVLCTCAAGWVKRVTSVWPLRSPKGQRLSGQRPAWPGGGKSQAVCLGPSPAPGWGPPCARPRALCITRACA